MSAMDILDMQVSLFVPATGKQADSCKRSGPIWSLPKSGRDDAKKVFLGKKQSQDVIGRDSPGHNYDVKRQSEDPKWGFGTAAARPPAKTNKYNEPYNDLVGNIPDSQEFKYHQRNTKIGGLRRGAPSNSPDFEGYPAGAISPGPQRYNPSEFAASKYGIRLGHAPSIDQIPPSYTMRQKTKVLESESQTGPKVGPGYYPTPEACGVQASSEKKSHSKWSICKNERFSAKRVSDSGRLWDGFGDQKEKQCRMFGRSPSFGFGTSTRDHAKKIHRCDTKLDKGPAADMKKMSVSTPSLPPRHEVMRYSQVPTGG